MGNWIYFKTNNASFANCVKMGITPLSYRKYDSGKKAWFVWWEKGPELIDMASRYYDVVDRSELPPSWQLLMAGGRTSASFEENLVVGCSPFQTLFITESAPKSVVKAAYKALLLEYHPDHNDGCGDREKLNEVIEAYREIMSTFTD